MGLRSVGRRELKSRFGSASGLNDIKAIAVGLKSTGIAPTGAYQIQDMWGAYQAHVLKFLDLKRPLRVVVDGSNGMAGKMVPAVFGGVSNLTLVPMLFECTGKFVHDPNPLVEANLNMLKAKMKGETADLGACFDGDADRCVFWMKPATLLGSDLVTTAAPRPRFSRRSEEQRRPRSSTTFAPRGSSPEEIKAAGGVAKRMIGLGMRLSKRPWRKPSPSSAGNFPGTFIFGTTFTPTAARSRLRGLLSVLSAHSRRS